MGVRWNGPQVSNRSEDTVQDIIRRCILRNRTDQRHVPSAPLFITVGDQVSTWQLAVADASSGPSSNQLSSSARLNGATGASSALLKVELELRASCFLSPTKLGGAFLTCFDIGVYYYFVNGYF
jgi:hypothetical protein